MRHQTQVLPVAEVMNAMRAAIRSGECAVSFRAPPAACATCGDVAELRFGHCHDCAMHADRP